MSNNQPTFDPLNPSPEEEDDMVRGYRDGLAGREGPAITSIAYDHGRRNGANDRAGVADKEQHDLAARKLGRIK